MIDGWKSTGRALEHGGRRMPMYTEEYASNGRLAVMFSCFEREDDGLVSEEPYSVISINVPSSRISEGEFVLSHDVDGVDGFRRSLEASGLFEDTGKRIDYGFVVGRPIWRLKEAA